MGQAIYTEVVNQQDTTRQIILNTSTVPCLQTLDSYASHSNFGEYRFVRSSPQLLSEIKHVLARFTLLSLLKVFHFRLKKFTFSLSKNAELPTSLDVFLGFFLSLRVFSLCLDEVPPTWSNSRESHTSEKECFNSFIFMRVTRVAVLYTSLQLVEGVYKPQRACVS